MAPAEVVMQSHGTPSAGHPALHPPRTAVSVRSFEKEVRTGAWSEAVEVAKSRRLSSPGRRNMRKRQAVAGWGYENDVDGPPFDFVASSADRIVFHQAAQTLNIVDTNELELCFKRYQVDAHKTN